MITAKKSTGSKESSIVKSKEKNLDVDKKKNFSYPAEKDKKENLSVSNSKDRKVEEPKDKISVKLNKLRKQFESLRGM